MKQIKTIDNKLVSVDDEDYGILIKSEWRTITPSRITYAVTKVCHRMRYMHRFILKTPRGKHTDHIDGNGLNNQRSNLRVVTCRENQSNRHTPSSSKYTGVTWNKQCKKWQAQIEIKQRTIYLGVYSSEVCARDAYNAALVELVP